MTIPRFRSRTFRRIFRKTPGGKSVLRYARRKPSKPQCGKCQKPLTGVAQGLVVMVRKMTRSARRPERPYGGVLCSSCTRRTLIAKAR